MKNKDNVKENNKMHNRRKINHKEKGITLVALVITIIILLILAGVTINTALSENGLFRMAKKAVNEYQESEKQEQTAFDSISNEMEKISIDYNDYVGAYVTGYNPKTGQCAIGTITSGDTINKQDQTFTTEKMQWRIWDYERTTKTIRLISARPTETQLTLMGSTGYNNGVWAVNEICRECYGSDKKGITVANLRRTDIQKVSTYDYKNYKHKPDKSEENQTDGTVYFGSSNSTYTNLRYPEMWAQYDSKWTYGYDGTTETGSDKECEMWEKENGDGNMTGKGEGSSNTTFKQSHYEHDFADCKDQFINETYYDLLFNDPDSGDPFKKYYWIASRYVHLNVEKCVFGLESVGAYSAVHRISRSRPIRVGSVYRLRPVVIFAP